MKYFLSFSSVLLLMFISKNEIKAQVPEYYYFDTLCHSVSTQIGIEPTDGYFYLWSPNFGMNNVTSSKPFFNLTNLSEFNYNEVYTLNVTDLFTNLIERHIFTITVRPVTYTSVPLLETSICVGDTVAIPFLSSWPENIPVNPPSFYQINLEDSVILFYPNQSTDYYLYTIDSINCVINQRNLNITIFEIETPSIGIDFTQFCVFDSIVVPLQLFPGNGIILGPGADTLGFFKPHEAGIGDHTIYYIFSNPGCQAIDSVEVSVFGNPEINFSLVPVVCKNDEPFLPDFATPSGGIYTVDGEIINFIDPSTLDVGIHTLGYTLFIGNNCMSSDSILFNVVNAPNKPTIDLSPNKPLCEGGIYELTSSFFTNYLWNTGDTTQSIMVDSSAFYFVDIISNIGCRRRSDTLFIQFVPPFNATLSSPFYTNGFNISTFQGQDGSIELNIDGGLAPFNLLWSNGNQNSFTLENLSEGEYFIFITDDSGCSDTLSIVLTGPAEPDPIDPIDNLPVIIPNGFTPNEDGLNDSFVIKNLELFMDNSLEIYNRYGNLVYQKDVYQNDWKGISNNGNRLPSGTYYYILKLNSELNINGFIDLRY